MIGFENIEQNLLNAYNSQKMHHAIMLDGKQGIGKASFAQELARKILQDNSQAHPDLLIVEKDSNKKEITVNKIRQVTNFTQQTAAISNSKFIIIDSACQLNKSAANALLKILEEPRPNNFIILICHNLNKILATIRSRCQIIKVKELNFANFQQILEQNNLNFNNQDLQFLAKINDNAPADAINHGLELVNFYQLFLRSISNKKISSELLKQVSNKEFDFMIFAKCCQFFLNRLIKSANLVKIDYFFEEEKVFFKLTNKFTMDNLLKKCQESLDILNKTPHFYLDKKLSLINIFNQFS